MLNNSPHTCLTGTLAHHHLHLATIKALNRFRIDASASLSNRQISAQTCTFLFGVWVWKRGKKTYLHAHKLTMLLSKCNRCKRVSRRNVCVCRKSAYRQWSYSATLDNLLGVKNVTVCSFPPNFRRDRIPYEIIRRSAKKPSISLASYFPPIIPNIECTTTHIDDALTRVTTRDHRWPSGNCKRNACLLSKDHRHAKRPKIRIDDHFINWCTTPVRWEHLLQNGNEKRASHPGKGSWRYWSGEEEKKSPRDEPDNGWCFTHS